MYVFFALSEINRWASVLGEDAVVVPRGSQRERCLRCGGVRVRFHPGRHGPNVPHPDNVWGRQLNWNLPQGITFVVVQQCKKICWMKNKLDWALDILHSFLSRGACTGDDSSQRARSNHQFRHLAERHLRLLGRTRTEALEEEAVPREASKDVSEAQS